MPLCLQTPPTSSLLKGLLMTKRPADEDVQADASLPELMAAMQQCTQLLQSYRCAYLSPSSAQKCCQGVSGNVISPY